MMSVQPRSGTQNNPSPAAAVDASTLPYKCAFYPSLIALTSASKKYLPYLWRERESEKNQNDIFQFLCTVSRFFSVRSRAIEQAEVTKREGWNEGRGNEHQMQEKSY